MKQATWAGRFTAQRKNGTRFLAYLKNTPLFDEQKVQIGIICITRDISAEIENEEKQRLLESQLKESQEIAAIGSWNYDVNSQQPTWTTQMFRLFNIGPEDGEPNYQEHRKYIHPDDWEIFDAAVQGAIESGIGYDIEIRLVQPSGKIIWVNARCETRLESDAVVELFGTTQDISNKKKVENELRQSNAFLESIYEGSDIGIFVVDVVEPGHYRYAGISPVHEKLIRMPNEKIAGKSPDELVDHFGKETVAYAKDLYDRAVKDKQPIESEFHDENKGEGDWVLNRVMPLINERGEVYRLIGTGLIITERKIAEQALQESQERFERAMEATQDGLYDWNLKTNEIYYSPGWKSMLGYAYDELPNDFSVWETLTEPEDVKRSWAMQNELINKKRDRFEIEFKMRHKEGHWVDILSRASAIFDQEGEAIRIIGTHVDISERKKISKTLQERNTYIESILDNMPIGFAINTIDDGEVKYMNDFFEEIYGWSRNVLTNVSIFFEKVFPDAELREEMMDKIITDMESGDPERMRWDNLKIVTSTGEEKYVYAFNIPLIDQNLMISTVQDITKRKLAEEEKNLREMHLRSLFENPAGYFIYRTRFDRSTNQIEVIQVSPSFEELLGLPQAETGCFNKWFTHVHPDDLPALLQANESGMKSPFKLSMDFRYNHPKDGLRWLDLRSTGIPYDDNPDLIEYANGMIIDITDRKLAEQELEEHRDRLEELVAERTHALETAQDQLVRQERLAALGQLAGGVGHELRNPLGVITNAVYFLKMIHTDTVPKVTEYLDLIEDNALDATRIISDLLDFARIQTRQSAPSDMGNLVREVLSQAPPPEGVHVDVNISSNLSLVEVDPKQIKQVISNLIINGYQAMPSGGHIFITAQEDGQNVVVSITDSGSGIAPENLDKIFEPLFTTKSKGIGLGLAISKMLTEANNGGIDFEIRPGEGTVFTVKFPVSEASP